jgi:hypothetical protein
VICRRMCLAQFLQRGVCASVPHCWHLFMMVPLSARIVVGFLEVLPAGGASLFILLVGLSCA